MVEYIISKKEKKQQITSIFFRSIVGIFIFWCFCILMSIYFLIIGCVADAEMLTAAYGSFFGVVVVAIAFAIRYFYLIHVAMKNFDAVSKDGRLIMQFGRTESEYIFSNISSGNVIKYNINNISKVKIYKKCIMVSFNGGKLEILPNSEEIINVGQFK